MFSIPSRILPDNFKRSCKQCRCNEHQHKIYNTIHIPAEASKFYLYNFRFPDYKQRRHHHHHVIFLYLSTDRICHTIYFLHFRDQYYLIIFFPEFHLVSYNLATVIHTLNNKQATSIHFRPKNATSRQYTSLNIKECFESPITHNHIHKTSIV